MKKLMVSMMTVLLLCAIVTIPVNAKAENTPTPVSAPAPAHSPEATALIKRLEEIKAKDRSNMSAAEKKQLRKETREIKKELKKLSGGIYISAGAAILIAVLLIILL